MEKQIKEILENIENIRKEIKGMKLSYNIAFIGIGIWVLVISFLLIVLNGCTGPEFGYFMEGLAQGLADEENVSSSEPAGDPGVQESTASERASGLCRTSPAGQKVCSSVYRLTNSDLEVIDQAWLQTLSCANRYNRYITPQTIRPTTVYVTTLEVINRRKPDAIGLYDPKTKEIWITPKYFSSILMEYGHYIDSMVGLHEQTEHHEWSTYSIQCSDSPIKNWLFSD